MALTRRTPSNSNGNKDTIPNLEAKEYDARLVKVVDVGLHQDEYNGEVKPVAQKAAIAFEIIGETVEIDGKESQRYIWARPFNIFKNLTEKGSELKYYSVFDPSAKKGDDANWDAQLGKPCSVFVDQNKNGYDEVVRVSPIPEKYQADVPPATMELFCGDGGDPKAELFGLAKWHYDNQIEGGDDTPNQEPRGESSEGFDDDVPY